MIEELEARLRQLEVRITMGANETCGEAAETLKRYREALEHIAFYHGEGHRVTEIARQALAENP